MEQVSCSLVDTGAHCVRFPSTLSVLVEPLHATHQSTALEVCDTRDGAADYSLHVRATITYVTLGPFTENSSARYEVSLRVLLNHSIELSDLLERWIFW
jgi:hypothetical protein